MMMEHWSSAMDRARARPAEERDGAKKPTQAYFSAVAPTTEQAVATNFAAGEPIDLSHPAMGVRSWIRFMPEEGSSAVVSQRSDTATSEVVYWSGSRAQTKIDAYLRGVGHYRVLDLGEVEISSAGLAQAHFTRRGRLALRGGTTRGWLSNDEQEIGWKAATQRRLLHDHQHSNALVGEERYGLVWRYQDDDYSQRVYIKKDGDYAREYLRSLSFEGTPGELAVYREGLLYDFEGEEMTGPTGAHLRVYGRWANADGTGKVSYDMDEDGNIWWQQPATATTGYTFNSKKGTIRLKAGDKMQLGADNDVEFSGQNMTIHARGIMTLKSDAAINIDGGAAVSIVGANVTIKGRIVKDGPPGLTI